MLDVRDFGAIGDGTADDTDAFEAAIAAAGRAVLSIPPGTYRLTRTLRIEAATQLLGANPGLWYSGSVLLFSPGIPGIVIESHGTGTPGGNGQHATVRNLAVKALYKQEAPPGSDADGIRIHTIAAVENVWVNNFARDGIHIEGSSPTANPNLWRVNNCQVDECGRHGLLVSGGDANAGCAVLLSVTANDGWGINDEASLGSTYLACHARTNTLGPYRTAGGVNESKFFGCYAESDQPPCEFSRGTLILGGPLASGLEGEASYWAEGMAQMRLKQAYPNIPPLQLAAIADGIAPLLRLLDHAGSPRGGFTAACTLELGRDVTHQAEDTGTLPWIELFQQTPGIPLQRWGCNDPGGYNAPVADVVARAVGPNYGDGRLAFRVVGPGYEWPDVMTLYPDGVGVGGGRLRETASGGLEWVKADGSATTLA